MEASGTGKAKGIGEARDGLSLAASAVLGVTALKCLTLPSGPVRVESRMRPTEKTWCRLSRTSGRTRE